MTQEDVTKVWNIIQEETLRRVKAEPILASFFHSMILEHHSFSSAIANQLANDLSTSSVLPLMIRNIIKESIKEKEEILEGITKDLIAVKERDPACKFYSTPLLFFKGFRALQSHRVAHWLWNNQRHTLALFFQSRASEVYDVDIHPAASIGNGVMIDHGSGVVIGETAIIEDNVSIFAGVILGGTGKERGNRHPKIREGVLLSSSSIVLGDVEVGKFAKVAAGSVVLQDVEEHTTVAGIPAKPSGSSGKNPASEVDHSI
jgi:serine O-acetyltransferase